MEVTDMEYGKKESWGHHVFVIDKANTNQKLVECEMSFDNENDRQKCYADIKKHRTMR
jgi:hypothetical protein